MSVDTFQWIVVLELAAILLTLLGIIGRR